MPNRSFASKSAVAQLADHLREQILNGKITGTMPGVNHLVRVLGLGTKTVLGAIASLEKEGLIESQGGQPPPQNCRLWKWRFQTTPCSNPSL